MIQGVALLGSDETRTFKAPVLMRRFIPASAGNTDGNQDGSLLWNFTPVGTKKSTYLDKQRAGFLLYRKGGQ